MATNDPARLREKLRKIEALLARAGADGERLAAGAALGRVRARLAALKVAEPTAQMQFTLAAPWSRRLFVALCRRYGLEPFRLPRQRLTTVMLTVPQEFVDQVLWPEFEELNQALEQYLAAVAVRLIGEEVHADTREAEAPTSLAPAAAADR